MTSISNRLFDIIDSHLIESYGHSGHSALISETTLKNITFHLAHYMPCCIMLIKVTLSFKYPNINRYYEHIKICNGCLNLE